MARHLNSTLGCVGVYRRDVALPLDSAVREIEQLGGRAIACPCDVSDEGALEQAAKQIEEVFGPIDIWINDAMVTVLGPVKKLSSEEIKRVTDVTYLGSVNGILVAARRMIAGAGPS